MTEKANAQGPSKLVADLISASKATRQAALSRVLSMRNQQALDAVEEAIKRLTGKQHIEFYKPGGMRMGMPQQAYDQILQLAREGKFADEPALVQSLIPGVAFLNQDLMTELERADAEALTIYQYLGVQMQLKMMIG
jgi:hypothetical protein